MARSKSTKVIDVPYVCVCIYDLSVTCRRFLDVDYVAHTVRDRRRYRVILASNQLEVC